MTFDNIQVLENIEHEAAKPRPDRAEQRLLPGENREGHALFGLNNLDHQAFFSRLKRRGTVGGELVKYCLN